MKLIASKRGKADKYDRLHCIRRDGSETACDMPRQGILFRRTLELNARWQQVPFHGSLELELEHV